MLGDACSVTTMRWFRSRKRAASYLALFALAFQLAVSFGHVHLERIAPPSMGASALAHAQPSAADLNAPSNPAGREDLADDCCPICTLIDLERIAPPSMGASALAHAQPSAADLNAPSNPAGREDLADDCCPICTLIHL